MADPHDEREITAITLDMSDGIWEIPITYLVHLIRMAGDTSYELPSPSDEGYEEEIHDLVGRVKNRASWGDIKESCKPPHGSPRDADEDEWNKGWYTQVWEKIEH